LFSTEYATYQKFWTHFWTSPHGEAINFILYTSPFFWGIHTCKITAISAIIVIYPILEDLQEIANDIAITKGSAQAILMIDLDMYRVAVKFVPKLLSCEQELHHDVVQEMLCLNNDLDFLKIDHCW